MDEEFTPEALEGWETASSAIAGRRWDGGAGWRRPERLRSVRQAQHREWRREQREREQIERRMD